MTTPSIDQLITEARRSLPQLDETRVRDAYEFAATAHGAQLRKSGEPYITHPLAAALHLTTLPVDEDTLIACLLHDVPEDTSVTVEQIQERFGGAVGRLVEGITKLSRVYYKNDMEERQVESMRRMFLVMARDLRVVLIKLADRLHNMQTLHWVDPEKRVRIARETLEIYAPLADRLGIWQFKWQLEDHCFRHLFPLEEAALRRSLTEGQQEREAYIVRVKKVLQRALGKTGLAGAEINGRTKHLYSIFHKMQRKQKTLAEIYDLFALRVIVPTNTDCYTALGIIHDLWKPKPGRFKDYIAVPKPNGYQSLHTTVFCVDGRLTEFQIRTQEMHRDAEFGAPAHWFYNEMKKGPKGARSANGPTEWMRNILELNEATTNSQDFLEGLKLDVFNDRIFVFTPLGDVKDLPKGATALDFAYIIHTDVGHRTQGVKINGSIAQLTTVLKTGDVVEVLTGKAPAPKRDWLKIVRTSQARTKIRNYLKTQDRSHNIAVGRGLLDRSLDMAGKDRAEKLTIERWKPVFDALNLKTVDDVLAGIGEGTFPTLMILKRLFRQEELLTEVPVRRGSASKTEQPRIYIQGSRDLECHPAKCCMPKVGEKIVALVTKSKGITVHRVDCRSLRNSNPERLIHASWEAPSELHRYTSSLEVSCTERPGLTRDILQALSQVDVVVLRLEVISRTADELVELLVVEISNLEALTRLLDSLERVSGVLSIRRRVAPVTT